MKTFDLIHKEVAKLHWTEKAELYNMALMLLSIPFDSGVGLIFACLWILSMALKNTLLKRWSFFGWHQDKTYHYNKSYHILIPMMCLWVVYLLSLLWTENMVTGWGEVGQWRRGISGGIGSLCQRKGVRQHCFQGKESLLCRVCVDSVPGNGQCDEL